jgi:hypothetical protein
MAEGMRRAHESDASGTDREPCPHLIVVLQVCEGSTCLTQAMPSIGTDPEAGQGSSTGEAGARLRVLDRPRDRCPDLRHADADRIRAADGFPLFRRADKLDGDPFQLMIEFRERMLS